MFKPIQFYIFSRTFMIGNWLVNRFTPGGQLLLAATIAAFAVGFNTNANMAYQLFGFLLALLLLALGSTFFFRSRFLVRRYLPRYGMVGQPLPYRIEVFNHSSKLHADLWVDEELPDPHPTLAQFKDPPADFDHLYDAVARMSGGSRWFGLYNYNQRARLKAQTAPEIAPKSSAEARLTLEPRRRGRLELCAVTLSKPDPLGLFYRLQRIPQPEHLIILPKLYAVRPLTLPGSRKHQPGGVALASRVGDSEEFVSLRDYRPGDPLRRIHWRSWARTGRPVVKEYQEEFFVRYALVLDTFTAESGAPVFEEAVSVAASIVHTMHGSDALLDLMFVGPQAYCFTSGRGLGHTHSMLEILAGVDVCRDKSFETLSPLIMERAVQLSACVCVFIAWDEQRMRLVQMLLGLRLPVKVLLITPAGFSGPLTPPPDFPNFHRLEVGQIQEGLKNI